VQNVLLYPNKFNGESFKNKKAPALLQRLYENKELQNTKEVS
jgi:hypothetical protein